MCGQVRSQRGGHTRPTRAEMAQFEDGEGHDRGSKRGIDPTAKADHPFCHSLRHPFPGAPVIVGHPRLYLTRMAHDPQFLLQPAGASWGKWDEP